VIANTSPLQYLHQCGLTDLLAKLLSVGFLKICLKALFAQLGAQLACSPSLQ
jgi:hypothetical protein